MARYLHSIAKSSQSITADTVTRVDLPVNPISFILLRLAFLNNGTNKKATMANILATLDKVEVLWKGNAVVSLSGEDLFAYAAIMNSHGLRQSNVINVDNGVRSVTLPIFFSPMPYDPINVFPAVERGNLTLELDWATSFSNLDGVTLQVETVELPEARPAAFYRATTLTLTPTAVGDNDLVLPVGNTITGLLLFGTTIPTGTTATKTINSVRLLADGNSIYIDKASHEVLSAMWALGRSLGNDYDEHFHLENTNATYSQNADTAAAEQDDGINAQYQFIDFDPTHDLVYALDTGGIGELKLRIDAGDTNELRAVPIERITV